MLSGKTFLITGASGRLGYETVLRLEGLGATVLPLVLTGYPLLPKRVLYNARTSLIPVHKEKDLLSIAHPDYVINFHWRVDRSLSFTNQLLFEILHNLQLPAALWDWLSELNISCFVNISTTRVFSHLNTNPITSRTEPRPLSPYGIAKLAAEKFFDARFCRSVWPVVHLRLCSVVSPGEHPSHLMSQLYKSAYENKKITINKGHLCTLIYIDEVVDIIINAALTAVPGRYIITTEPVPITHVVSEFETISDRKINATYIDLQPGMTDPLFESDREHLLSSWTRQTCLNMAIKNYIAACNSTAHLCLHANPCQNHTREDYDAKSS